MALEVAHNPIMANTAATATVLGLLGLSLEPFSQVLKETFKKKSPQVLEQNLEVAQRGYQFAKSSCPRCSFTLRGRKERLLLINGTQAMGLGALLSGCKFYSAYPMTPSTGIMLYLAQKAQEYGLVVEQAEDEIAAINMALGASFAGVRAMTATSGGGFALMVEGLSLAGMTETPIVIAECQRPGPATGLPTRTEQADLLYVLHAGHGEFAKVLFAPGSPKQALRLMNKAFELSERFQVPALVLIDQYLADSQWTFSSLNTSALRYQDYRLRGEALQGLSSYRRHALTDTGVSPLAPPCASHHLVVTDSDEHDEEGHIIEDAPTRVAMVKKRLHKKLPLLRREIEPPTFYGQERPEVMLVGWGSMYGLLREAVDALRGALKVGMLHFSELYPFPLQERYDFMGPLQKARRSICIEQNASGQFAHLMKAETGFSFDALITRYDGRPFMLEELLEEIDAHI